MPGFLLHVGATVTCAHGGRAQPIVSNPRVMVMGQPTVTRTASYRIFDCSLPPNGNGPCVTAQWITAARRITSNGQALLLRDSRGICAPTGAPLIPIGIQTRVTGA